MHTLPDKDIVLLGIGHTNAHVLRMWRMRPLSGARLTCVSNEAVATYSGMLPGVLAGQYPPERMEIDLVRLSAAAGARLVVGDVTGLAPAMQELLFADRPPMRFDVLSIGIGSVPTFGDVRIADGARLVPIKPMQTFLARLNRRLGDAAGARGGAPIRIAIVGGGAGGVEMALCLPAHLSECLGEDVRFAHHDRDGRRAAGAPQSRAHNAPRRTRADEPRCASPDRPPGRGGGRRNDDLRRSGRRGSGSDPLGNRRRGAAAAWSLSLIHISEPTRPY